MPNIDARGYRREQHSAERESLNEIIQEKLDIIFKQTG